MKIVQSIIIVIHKLCLGGIFIIIKEIGCFSDINNKRIFIEAFGKEINNIVFDNLNLVKEIVLIAKEKDETIGFIIFSKILIENERGSFPELSLTYLYVKFSYRRRGVGTQLIKSGLKMLENKGFSIIVALLLSNIITKNGFMKAKKYNISCPFIGNEIGLYVKFLNDNVNEFDFRLKSIVKYQVNSLESFLIKDLIDENYKENSILKADTFYISCKYDTDKLIFKYKKNWDILIKHILEKVQYIKFGLWNDESEKIIYTIKLFESCKIDNIGKQIFIKGVINENIVHELNNCFDENNSFKWFSITFSNKLKFDGYSLMHVEHYGKSIYFTNLGNMNTKYVKQLIDNKGYKDVFIYEE